MPFVVLFIIVFLMSMAGAEEHVHGVDVPDWYDANCCNQRDCKPVDRRDEPEAIMHGTEPAYRWHGLIFEKSKFKRSQDERFHVCIQPGMNTPLCIYLPTFI